MHQFTIIASDGNEEFVSRTTFYEKLANEKDKPADEKEYFQYHEGGIHVLLHKSCKNSRLIYQAHMRPKWNEAKRIERMTRCHDGNGNICKGKCSGCSKESERPNRVPISLDMLAENGRDECTQELIDAIVMDKLLLEDLCNALDKEMIPLLEEVILGGKSLRSYVDECLDSSSDVSSNAMYQRLYRKMPRLKKEVGDFIKKYA